MKTQMGSRGIALLFL